MTKYRKRIKLFDAWEWDETRATFDKLLFAGMTSAGHTETKGCGTICHPDIYNLVIETPFGFCDVKKGDIVIRDESGDFSTCNPDSFKRIYEEEK